MYNPHYILFTLIFVHSRFAISSTCYKLFGMYNFGYVEGITQRLIVVLSSTVAENIYQDCVLEFVVTNHSHNTDTWSIFLFLKIF